MRHFDFTICNPDRIWVRSDLALVNSLKHLAKVNNEQWFEVQTEFYVTVTKRDV